MAGQTPEHDLALARTRARKLYAENLELKRLLSRLATNSDQAEVYTSVRLLRNQPHGSEPRG